MGYQFKEAILDSNFRNDDIQNINLLINSSTPFSVVGLPGMGISIFLRYLATTQIAYFIHVDINELPKFSNQELFKSLLKEITNKNIKTRDGDFIKLCKKELEKLVINKNRIVIIFNRFDKLKKQFNAELFSNLRVLRDVDKEKIVMIFAANKPLVVQTPDLFQGGNLTMFSESYFLKPYSKCDLIRLHQLNSPNRSLPLRFMNKAFELSGGHYQLFQLLIRSEYLKNNPLSDSIIQLQFKELLQLFTHDQKKQLLRIALLKKLNILTRYY